MKPLRMKTTDDNTDHLRPLDELADADENLFGTKAVMLAKLRRLGVKTPQGVAVRFDSSLDFELPLKGRICVRSSSTLEDRNPRFAGAFDSFVNVDASDWKEYAERVRVSALSSKVRWASPDPIKMGLLIHEFVKGPQGKCRVYPNAIVLECEDEWLVAADGLESRSDQWRMDPLAILKQVRDVANALSFSSAELEWTIHQEQLYFLQIKPIENAPLSRGEKWVGPEGYDLAARHFPAQVSPMQASILMKRCLERQLPYDVKVVNGYVFSKQLHKESASEISLEEAEVVWRSMFADWELDEQTEFPERLVKSVNRYFDFCDIYDRRTIDPDSAGNTLMTVILGKAAISLEAVLEDFGHVANSWDIASPPLVEDEVMQQLVMDNAVINDSDTVAEFERDDWWYFKAQAQLRSDVIAAAKQLGIATSECFDYSIDNLVKGSVDTERSFGTWEAYRDNPPTLVLDEVSHWQGRGSGGATTGIAKLFVAPYAPVRGQIVVAKALLPSHGLLLTRAAAIVTEANRELDHAVAVARDLGIPCVVGCVGITSAIVDGDVLKVDGATGRVAVSRSQIRNLLRPDEG